MKARRQEVHGSASADCYSYIRRVGKRFNPRLETIPAAMRTKHPGTQISSSDWDRYSDEGDEQSRQVWDYGHHQHLLHIEIR